jgi:hypothetical protein
MSSYTITIQLGETNISIPMVNHKFKKCFANIKNDDGTIVLKPNECHDSIYNKILDNASDLFTFDMLINTLSVGIMYFDELDISTKSIQRISTWVKRHGKYSYTWTELLDKPDYGLELFNKRFWPYFNVDCKEWQDIATATLQESEYPNQTDVSNINTDSDRNEIVRDYKLEYGISQKYNNFLGYTVLDPTKYPDVSKTIKKLAILEKLNMKLLMFETILRLLISPASCHIIKNPDFMKLVNPLFNENKQYKDIFVHFMYYAMFILNHEDTVMFSQINCKHRIIYTHAEALSMPHTHLYHVELDPYIQQLTGETYLVQSMPYYIRCKRYIQPISVFEHRFYLATGGALANIPLYKYNAAVSGSILIPCLTYSELEDDFKRVRFNTARAIKNQVKFNDNIYTPVGNNKLTEDDKDFMSYLEYLYPSYHSLSNSDYVRQVLTQSELTDTSTESKNNNAGKPQKENKLNYNLLSDIDISISIDNYDTFEELALLIGEHIQKNCSHIGEVWIKKVITASSFKYKIYGPGLLRPIDLFRVPYGPEKMVKKFHCPIVRSWYNGSNSVVDDTFKHNEKINEYWLNKSNKLDIDYNTNFNDELSHPNAEQVQPNMEPTLPILESNIVNQAPNSINNNGINYNGINLINSGLCAALSGVNNNYKWFFNAKPCVEVILKYAQRGFSTICNKKEITALNEYMKTNPKWKDFVSTNFDMCGIVSKEHIFFNPCINNGGIRYKLRNFKKPSINTYSKKLYDGIPKGMTAYNVNLAVKNNTKIYMPDISKINSFVEHMDHLNNIDDEFSDTDEL